MAPEPQHSETMSGASASSEPADFGANAALILAALGRIEAVVRDERAALASLRASLAEMAQAIARAKAVADSENAAAMLDEFEHRVDAMIEIAGGTPAAQPPAEEPATEPAAESDQVPTVSDVVLRLGPNDAAPEPAAEAEPPAETAADKGPTVAMLTAMVEALSASIQTPEPEADIASPEPQAIEPPPETLEVASESGAVPAETVVTTTTPSETLEMAPEVAAAPVEAEVRATATPEVEPAVEAMPAVSEAEPVVETVPVVETAPVAEAVPPSLPGETLAQESTLIASLVQMETRPFPPPEVGTAVIFTTKFEPEANAQAEHGFASPVLPEPELAPEPAPPATTEAAEIQVLAEPAAKSQPEPVTAAAPEPAATADVVTATAEPEEMAQPAEIPSAETDFDPADFLFGPDPEPDPAAFLLDATPPPRTQKAVLPQAEFVAVPPAPPQAEEQEAVEPNTEPPKAEESHPARATETGQAEPAPEPTPHDPLHALKAMSPNERLAIFS